MTTPSVAPTEIFLLGTVAVSQPGGVVRSPGISGPALELFAYLLTFSRRALTRDHLGDLLWEDREPERSRAALNTALWRVRQAVRRLSGIALSSGPKVVRMDMDETVRLDTALLRSIVQTAIGAFSKEDGLPCAVRRELVEVLERADGSFLEGSSANWVLVEREEYLNIRLRGLTMLMQDAGIRAVYEDALSFGRRILAVDPFREAVQCEMLWLYTMTGRRAFAIRHYRDYERLLRRELGIAPMAETRAVYDLICADTTVLKQPVQLLFGDLAKQPAAQSGVGLVAGEIENNRRSFYKSHFASGA